MFALKVLRLDIKTEVSGIFNVGFYTKFWDKVIRTLVLEFNDVSAVSGVFA